MKGLTAYEPVKTPLTRFVSVMRSRSERFFVSTVKLGGTSCNNIDVWKFADEGEEDVEKEGLQEATSNVYGNGHTSLYADMVDAIRNDRKPYVDAVAGMNALEMVLAVYKSQLTGMPVTLPLKEFSSVDMAGEFGEGSL